MVTLSVAGEDEPAHDFAASATKAVRDIVSAGRAARPELKVTIKRVVERNDDD